MYRHRIGAGAQKAWCALILFGGLGVFGASPVAAQTAPAAAATADGAPSEAARRAAASPFRFILQNASAPPRAKPAPTPAPAAAETKRAAPVEQALAAPSRTTDIPSAPSTQPAPSSQGDPTPLASLAPKPTEPLPVVKAPKELIPVKQDPPELTTALLREQASGTVRIGFEVNPDGSTGEVRVISSTNRRLNNISLEAISGWKFQPIDETRALEIELVYNNKR
jgi:TonB family protein